MTLSKHNSRTGPFEILKMFYSRGEMRSIFSRGPIVFTFTLFGLGNVYDTFKMKIQR